MPEPTCERVPLWVEAKRDAVRLIESRFTGFICAGVITVACISWVLEQCGIGASPLQLGELAKTAFVVYVLKHAYKAQNGNGVKP